MRVWEEMKDRPGLTSSPGVASCPLVSQCQMERLSENLTVDREKL